MPYSVQAAEPNDHTAASVTVGDRQEALKIAQSWSDSGKIVRIIGDGMIYTLEQFIGASAVGTSKARDNVLPWPSRDREPQ